MLSRVHRFHGRSSLSFVYKNGKTVKQQFVAARYCINPKRTTYRVAVVISKKTEKSAVARNRIRRRVYEIVRGLGDTIHKPYDIVITVYSSKSADISSQKLSDQIGDILAKANIIGK